MVEILSCDARDYLDDIQDDAIYVLVSINKFDYLVEELPSVAVFEKYAFIYFFIIISCE